MKKSSRGSNAEPGRETAKTDIEAVRSFWNHLPLFVGESSFSTGEREFFEEHLRLSFHEFGERIPEIFFADVGPGTRAVDIGCGIGVWVQRLREHGADVTACDLTEAAVRLTRRRIELFDLRAVVTQGNAEQLPFATGAFDHVNCQGVIHHTPNTEACIEEFHRILKPNGTLSFSVYYKVWALRSPMLFQAVRFLSRPMVNLRGRGRERMFSVNTPEDLVRYYDGADNPIGKAYTMTELKNMVRGKFHILARERFLIPRRALPIALPDGVFRRLARSLGLMVVLRCRKIA